MSFSKSSLPISLDRDLDYAVNAHYKLLKKKMRQCADLGADSWSCYHSRTPRLREYYARMVNRYYTQH